MHSRRYGVATLPRVTAAAKGEFTGVAPDIHVLPYAERTVRVVVADDREEASVLVSSDDLANAVFAVAARVDAERAENGA